MAPLPIVDFAPCGLYKHVQQLYQSGLEMKSTRLKAGVLTLHIEINPMRIGFGGAQLSNITTFRIMIAPAYILALARQTNRLLSTLGLQSSGMRHCNTVRAFAFCYSRWRGYGGFKGLANVLTVLHSP